MTKSDEYELSILLIKKNIDKKPMYHISNFKDNNILWNKSKIKRLVYQLQEEEYPLDKNIMNKLVNEHIYFGDTKYDGNKYNICPKQIFINDLNNKYNDHLIFLTTIFQLKTIKECETIFIDGTFLSCPKSFKQILNILGYINTKNLTIPLISIIMKTKNENAYFNIFEDIKIMLTELKLNINFKNIYIISDFEKGLRNAIIKSFLESKILGCYFHYIKCLIGKFKSLGMLYKKYTNKACKLLFFFKLFPFLYEKDKNELLNNIINAFISNENKSELQKFYYFILYYIKNWYGNPFINYTDLDDIKFKFRKNNKVELFHLLLNNIIEPIRPKFSYFLEKEKNLIKNFYDHYLDNLHNIIDEESNKIFLSNDFMNFILKLMNKYKSIITYNIISQLETEDDL